MRPGQGYMRVWHWSKLLLLQKFLNLSLVSTCIVVRNMKMTFVMTNWLIESCWIHNFVPNYSAVVCWTSTIATPEVVKYCQHPLAGTTPRSPCCGSGTARLHPRHILLIIGDMEEGKPLLISCVDVRQSLISTRTKQFQHFMAALDALFLLLLSNDAVSRPFYMPISAANSLVLQCESYPQRSSHSQR